MKRWVFLGAMILSTLVRASEAGGPVFGRYLGVLHHESLNREQLAKLDFILHRTSDQKLELKAILTLHFGDYESKEYVAYRFERVEYHPLTGLLYFEEPTGAITLKVTAFQAPWVELEAEARALTTSSRIGKLRLRREGPAQPSLPLIEPVWGEYRGKCDGRVTYLQLKTYRSSGKQEEIGNPFSTYQIAGSLAQPDPNLSLTCEESLPGPV